jgi:hypothetical protein
MIALARDYRRARVRMGAVVPVVYSRNLTDRLSDGQGGVTLGGVRPVDRQVGGRDEAGAGDIQAA